MGYKGYPLEIRELIAARLTANVSPGDLSKELKEKWPAIFPAARDLSGIISNHKSRLGLLKVRKYKSRQKRVETVLAAREESTMAPKNGASSLAVFNEIYDILMSLSANERVLVIVAINKFFANSERKSI